MTNFSETEAENQTETTDRISRRDVRKAIKVFADLMEMGEQYETSLKREWETPMLSLMKQANVPVDDFCRFLKWAAEDNPETKPGMNSVEYLAMARDRIGSLSKNFDTLWRTYGAKKKLAGVKRKVQASNSNPLPLDVATWLMNGPGINRPLNGWTSARQKLDAIKENWYGVGWETRPDPPFDIEELFEYYVKNLSIITDEGDYLNV